MESGYNFFWTKMRLPILFIFLIISCSKKNKKTNPVNEKKISFLKSVIKSEKCKDFSYLNPTVLNSTPDCTREIDLIFNRSCEEIIEVLEIEGDNKVKIKEILVRNNQNTSNSEIIFDTEDHEFCYFLLRYLCEELDLDINEII